jgi:hypothetical protein
MSIATKSGIISSKPPLHERAIDANSIARMELNVVAFNRIISQQADMINSQSEKINSLIKIVNMQSETIESLRKEMLDVKNIAIANKVSNQKTHGALERVYGKMVDQHTIQVIHNQNTEARLDHAEIICNTVMSILTTPNTQETV